MSAKIVFLPVFYFGMLAFVSGCSCCHRDDDGSKHQSNQSGSNQKADDSARPQPGAQGAHLPPEVIQILRKHFVRGANGEVLAGALKRADFTADELVQLDHYASGRSRAVFESVNYSDCSCTTGAGSKGVYVNFPWGTFCESCGG